MAAYRFFEGSGGADAPVIYAIDMEQHPFDYATASAGLSCHVATLVVDDWDRQMSPWPAPGLYEGDADFPGDAGEALAEFTEVRVPAVEAERGLAPRARAVAGYSMGGLFATWALLESDLFDAAASMSGSLWYPGWLDYLPKMLAGRDLTGRSAYFSLGTKEKRARSDILKSVEANTLATCDALAAVGARTRFEPFPGGHMTGVPARTRAGLLALDEWLTLVEESRRNVV